MAGRYAIAAIEKLERRDSNLPGFGLMFDPARLLAALRDQLDCDRVDDIRISYVRYKAGMNCLARYDLDVGGQCLHAYGKAHGSDSGTKLEKALQRPSVPTALGPGRVVLPQQRIVFSIFPNDAKLPSLSRLGDEGYRRRLWRRIFGQQSKWQCGVLDEVLNYKPEHRYVARLTRPDGTAALLKFYTRTGFEQVRRVGRLQTSDRGGLWAEVIGKSKKHAVLAFRWHPGHSLRELLDGSRLDAGAVRATGRLLAALHGSGVSGLPERNLQAQVAAIISLGRDTGYLLPSLQRSSDLVAQNLANWLLQREAPIQPVHGDFYDKQVIVCNDRARMIDFDSARMDDPLADVGNFCAHIEKRAIYRGGSAPGDAAATRTLLSAYREAVGGLDQRALDRYTAIGLFALIQNPFRDQLSDWPRQTKRILERVETLFAA